MDFAAPVSSEVANVVSFVALTLQEMLKLFSFWVVTANPRDGGEGYFIAPIPSFVLCGVLNEVIVQEFFYVKLHVATFRVIII